MSDQNQTNHVRQGEESAQKKISAKRPRHVFKVKKAAFAESEPLFVRTSFKSQFRNFREGGLGIFDSFFNAFYITICERAADREKKKHKKRGEHFHRSKELLLELNTPLLRFLSGIPYRFRSFFGGLKKKVVPFWHRDGGTKMYKRRRDFIKAHFLATAAVMVAVFCTFYVVNLLTKPIVLYAEVNGEFIGVVAKMEVAESAVHELEHNVARVLGTDFKFPYEISFTFHRERGATLSDRAALGDALYHYALDYITTANGIYIDDTLVAVCATEEEIRGALNRVTAEKAQELGDATAGIYNDIMIIEQAYPSGSIVTQEEVYNLLQTLTVSPEKRPHNDRIEENQILGVQSEAGKNAAQVPSSGMIADAEIPRAKTVSKESNQVQDASDIVLHFYVTRDVSYHEQIPYQTVYQEDSSRYTSMTDVITAGESGTRNVTARIYYVDGKEERREAVNEIITKQPTTEVIAVGTKRLPEELGITGFENRFIKPRIVAVYSGFGDREDGAHKGWDLTGKEGDSIYAAASGVVVTAIGQNGTDTLLSANHYTGYGYCVVIDHGDGYSTMYAHCSRIDVHLGQVVKQGDKIAEIGMTGVAEGNHVHFEIMKNRTQLNPALGYMYEGNTTIYDVVPADSAGRKKEG